MLGGSWIANMNQNSGYALMRHTSQLLANHLDLMGNRFAKSYWQMHDVIGFLDPRAYRGSCRSPLEPFVSSDPAINVLCTSSGDVKSNAKARQLFFEILGEDSLDDFVDSLIPAYADAEKVYSLVDRKDEFEIVQLSRESFVADGMLLGYDIGYWGGDHFSLICDTVVMPTWHPVPEEHWPELATCLRHLNENLLFSTEKEAIVFRNWYRSNDWAEIEGNAGEFCTIQLCLPYARAA